jgi:hypothetical protein
MISNLSHVSYLIQKDHSLFIEFPLFDKSRLTYPQLEYLVDITQSQPIFIQLTSANLDSESSFVTTPSLSFPSTLSLSRQVTLPSWTKDTLLFDYIHSIERIFVQTWYTRQLFIYHLQSLCSVLEFDSIDFSVVTIALKVVKRKMIVLCTVEIQIPFQFPQHCVTLLVHDLMHSNTYPLPTPSHSDSTGSSGGGGAGKVPPEIVAKNVLLFIVREIEKVAFSES